MNFFLHLPGKQNIFSNFPDLAGAYGNHLLKMINLGKSRGLRFFPRPRIEPQSPSSQSDALAIRPQRPLYLESDLSTLIQSIHQ